MQSFSPQCCRLRKTSSWKKKYIYSGLDNRTLSKYLSSSASSLILILSLYCTLSLRSSSIFFPDVIIYIHFECHLILSRDEFRPHTQISIYGNPTSKCLIVQYFYVLLELLVLAKTMICKYNFHSSIPVRRCRVIDCICTARAVGIIYFQARWFQNRLEITLFPWTAKWHYILRGCISSILKKTKKKKKKKTTKNIVKYQK